MDASTYLDLKIATLDACKLGDALVADDGFDCLPAFETVVVGQDDHGLFVPCSCGRHYLDGQADHDDYNTIVGLRAV